jgi:hypothetical protein
VVRKTSRIAKPRMKMITKARHDEPAIQSMTARTGFRRSGRRWLSGFGVSPDMDRRR